MIGSNNIQIQLKIVDIEIKFNKLKSKHNKIN